MMTNISLITVFIFALIMWILPFIPTYKDLFVCYQIPGDTNFHQIALNVKYSNNNLASEKLRKIKYAIYKETKHENITIISISKL